MSLIFLKTIRLSDRLSESPNVRVQISTGSESDNWPIANIEFFPGSSPTSLLQPYLFRLNIYSLQAVTQKGHQATEFLLYIQPILQIPNLLQLKLIESVAPLHGSVTPDKHVEKCAMALTEKQKKNVVKCQTRTFCLIMRLTIHVIGICFLSL